MKICAKCGHIYNDLEQCDRCGDSNSTVKTCACGAIVPVNTLVCVRCGQAFEIDRDRQDYPLPKVLLSSPIRVFGIWLVSMIILIFISFFI